MDSLMKLFKDIKKHAIQDILSVSGKDKTSQVIERHMDNLINIALTKGAQYKQIEIDDLQKLVDEKIKMIVEQARTASNQQKRIDELQARVDAALGLITSWQDQSYRDDAEQLICVDLEQALKGGEK